MFIVNLGAICPQDLLVAALELPIISHNKFQKRELSYYLPLYVLCLFLSCVSCMCGRSPVSAAVKSYFTLGVI